MKTTQLAVLASCSLLTLQAHALTPLSENQLAEHTGQALLNVSTIIPSEQNNPFNGAGGAPAVGFYKIGVPGTMKLNTTIRKLQLGCGGSNGAGGCDVDIDYLRFLGQGAMETIQEPVLDGAGLPTGETYSVDRPINDGGPATDFKLFNPFMEMAIKNPDSLTDRQLVGIRVGADQAQGLISIGTRQVDTNNAPVENQVTINGVPQEDATKHTGINSLTGSIGRLSINGQTTVQANGSEITGAVVGEYDEVFSSRASLLRLNPLTADIPILPGRAVEVDFLSDLRLIHNLNINDRDVNDNITPAGQFYISLSQMGDNEVWVKSNGNKSYVREATRPAEGVPGETPVGGGDDVINAPRAGATDATSANPWLQWNTGADDGTGNPSWVAASKGWGLRVPSVEVRNFDTSVVELTSPPLNNLLYALVNNPDLGQVPADSCFGSLKFC